MAHTSNQSNIVTHLIYGTIFSILLVVNTGIFLEHLIPVGLIGIIIPLIGSGFHFKKAFDEGFVFDFVGIKIDNFNDFLRYVSANMLIASVIGFVITVIVYS